MKKLLISLAAMLSLPLLGNAQETLRIGDKTYNVADVEEITIANTRPTVADVLARHKEYSIFSEALEATGLADTLSLRNKFRVYNVSNTNGMPNTGLANGPYYYPGECKIKFTLLAVDNEMLKKYGVTDFASLKAKCAEWYAKAGQWYDYPGMDSKVISTGDDYTYTYNVVNMFMRYHILKAGMPYRKLVRAYDPNDENWNFAFGGEPHSYHETLLPNTLMKIWQPLYHNTGDDNQSIWVNRYRKNNTLTDQVGTFGSDEMHPLMNTGALVNKEKSDIRALNGYIHHVDRPLVYNEEVAHGVLNERLRVDCVDMMPELANNDIRLTTPQEIVQAYRNSDINGDMIKLPLDYCDNLKANSDKSELAVYTIGAWRSWNSTQITGWGYKSDISLRLPPVPTGDYEIRIIYPPMSRGTTWEFQLGTSNDTTQMWNIGGLFDTRYPNNTLQEDREATGLLLSFEFDDYGVASDAILRSNGYMRAPASFSRGTLNYIKEPVTNPEELIQNISNSCRYEEGYGTSILRRIVGTVHLEQNKNNWLRFKDVDTSKYMQRFSFDFIELVPVSVVNNPIYSEDWY